MNGKFVGMNPIFSIKSVLYGNQSFVRFLDRSKSKQKNNINYYNYKIIIIKIIINIIIINKINN